MSKLVGLLGYAAGDFLQIACHVCELDPKRTEPVGKLIDQMLSI